MKEEDRLSIIFGIIVFIEVVIFAIVKELWPCIR